MNSVLSLLEKIRLRYYSYEKDTANHHKQHFLEKKYDSAIYFSLKELLLYNAQMIPNLQIKKYFFVVITWGLLALTSVCAQTDTQPTTQRPAQWAVPVNTEFNLYQVDDQLFRSEQPQTKHIEQIKALGIKTIISFRAFHSDKDIFANTDIELISIPINTWNINDSHVIRTLNAIELAKTKGNVLIHCQHGADRTGLMAAMYRMVYQNWSKEDALKELVNGNYGYHAIWGNIPKYIRQVNLPYLIQRLQYAPQ